MDPIKLSDEELMKVVCADDMAAYDELVRRFQTRLFHFALGRLRDRQLAEDVVQEALLKVWRHKASFRHGSRLSTWIFALALNLCRDHWRRSKPESSLALPEVAAAAEHSGLRARADDASDDAEKQELSELLLDALEQLPAQSAKLLSSRTKDDLTLEEAGERLGMSPAASRAAASRAYKKLKGFLKKRMEP